MRTKIVLGLCALASLVVLPSEAGARTVPGQAGSAFFGTSDYNCFTSTTGILNSCTTATYWQLPVAWDTPTGPAKSISVSAYVGSGGSISCTYAGWDTQGNDIGNQINFPNFPSGFSTKAISVPSVPGGTFGLVYCVIGGNQSSILIGMNYTQ